MVRESRTRELRAVSFCFEIPRPAGRDLALCMQRTVFSDVCNCNSAV
jgi:hypothetical protein